MNSAGRSNILSIFQHGLQDGYVSLNSHVKGGLFPLKTMKPRTNLEEAEWSQFGSVGDDMPHPLQSANNKPAILSNNRKQYVPQKYMFVWKSP